MPIDIKVAPPGITISQGRTFMVTTQGGEINPQADEGVYAIDTRFISSYHFFINREPWVLVNSSQLIFYASRFYFTNPKIITEQGDIEANTIGLTIERTVEDGIHEDFYITNYTGKKVNFSLELALRSDFADIFEVKSKRLTRRGRVATEWKQKERSLRTTYDHEDFHRAVIYQVPKADVPVVYANGYFQVSNTDMHPTDFRADMGMLHQQVRSVTHATPCPIPQRKECCSTQVISFLDQITQDQPLIWLEDAGSKLLLCLDFDPAGRIPFQGFLFVNQPLTKVFDDGLDTGAMTHTISLLFEPREISFDDRHRQLVGLKVFGVPWAPSDPLCKLTQDTQIDINRRLVEFGETRLMIALDLLLVSNVRERNTVCWLHHFWSFLPTKFSAASFLSSFFASSLKYERAVRHKHFVCATNWQQIASSAATFLLRVSLAAIGQKCKWEAG